MKASRLSRWLCSGDVCLELHHMFITPAVLSCGHRVVRELTVGRRIGFYKIRGEIGCGNFSHVKLGIHALTKGKKIRDYWLTLTIMSVKCE